MGQTQNIGRFFFRASPKPTRSLPHQHQRIANDIPLSAETFHQYAASRPTRSHSVAFGLAALAGIAAAVTFGAGGAVAVGAAHVAGLALFHRITGAKALENPRREQLFKTIGENPGISYHELKRKLGWNTGSLCFHLSALERDRIVAHQKDQLSCHYYPADQSPHPKSPQEKITAGLRGELLHEVRSHQEITGSELARILGVSKQRIHYHITRLKRLGMLSTKHAGREIICSSKETDSQNRQGETLVFRPWDQSEASPPNSAN